MEAEVNMVFTSMHNYSKITTMVQNRYRPDSSENQAKLYGSLTTRYLKKPHSSRQVPFLQQAMLLRQGVKAAVPNTQKQTQGGCQVEETKKYGPNERTEKNSQEKN